MSKKQIVVIGGGIGGLATAALLAKDGHTVTLLEKNAHVGGRVNYFKEKGYFFDMGPSWYLMPEVFERYFALFGKSVSEYLSLVKLHPSYKVFFSRDDHALISTNLESTMAYFESLEPGVSSKLYEYLAKTAMMYGIAMDKFVYKNFNSFKDFLDPTLMKGLIQMELYKSFDQFVEKYTKNPRIKQILEYPVVFLGGSPHNTPAMYAIMSHVDFHSGVFYPNGGMYKLAQAFEKLVIEHGGQIKTGTDVEHIHVENGKATKVVTNKGDYDAEIVVSNGDYPYTEMHLLDKQNQSYSSNYWNKRKLAPSAFLMFLGVKGKLPQLEHHNLYFASNWDTHFKEIFTDPKWPANPSYYVNVPSRSDFSVAPEGCESVFVLVPVASGLKDTDAQRDIYTRQIITHLEYLIGENIQNKIVVQKTYAHRDYYADFHSYKGTALGLAHTLFQSAMFRPKNKSKKVSNLYYAGQYTTPGVGLPMCIISAQMVAQRIQEEQ